jgi:CubicO group peptidase (beta-lactamase class C family)
VLILIVLLMVGGAASGRTAGQEALTEGGWLAVAGDDRFVFVFDTPGAGPLTGMAHSLRDGRQYTQSPFTVESYEHPVIELVMAPNGVRFRGRVDLAAGRIDGDLLYSDDGGMAFAMVRIDPGQEPGFPARTGAAPYAYAAPPTLDDGWGTADAGDHGLTPALLEGIIAAVADGDAGLLHALLVVHGGELILEEYFHGYDRQALHPLASVTKSVSSLLVGLALGRGEIDDLQQPLLDFLPTAAPTDDRWQAVTLSHLLTMSMGLDWTDEQAEQVHGTGPGFFAGVSKLGFRTEPGAVFRYVNADVNLLSGVIKEATGLYPDQFAERHLFTPLGITDWNWDHGAVDGHRLMDGSLQLRPRDMARLGQLVLAEGRWRGQQLLPAAFVRAALSHRIDADDQPGGRGGYGYLWVTRAVDGADGPLEFAFANGWGSQFIFVIPALDLVVVTTGGNQDNGQHMAPLRVVGLPLVRGLGGM